MGLGAVDACPPSDSDPTRPLEAVEVEVAVEVRLQMLAQPITVTILDQTLVQVEIVRVEALMGVGPQLHHFQ